MDQAIPRCGVLAARLRTARPPLVDVAIAAAFVVLTVTEAAFVADVPSPVVHLVVSGIAMAALAWRRQFPLGVAVVAIAALITVDPKGELSTVLSLVLVSYTLGSETEPPRSWYGLALLVVPFIAGLATEGLVPSDVAAVLVFLVGPWAVGGVVRQRAERTAAAVEWAERLERDQSARPPRRPSRSAPGSPASCTTSCPTR